MEKIKLGLIGCGNYGQNLLCFLKHLEAFKVTAIADTDEQAFFNAVNVADTQIEYYSDYHDLLDKSGVEAVIIATPNDEHAEQAIEAMKKGISIYLEKPIACNIIKCLEVVETQRETGIKAMIGMQLRYGELYQKIKELIDDDVIGKPRMLWYKEFRGPFLAGTGDWRRSFKRTGGTIVEKNVHQFDLFNWYIGCNPVSIFAMSGSNSISIEDEMTDNAVILIRYENGEVGTIGLSLFSQGSEQDVDFVIAGEKGTLSVTNNGITLKKAEKSSSPIFYSVNQQFSKMGHGGTEYNALIAFANYLTKNISPLTGMNEGFISVKMALAAQQSTSDHREVFLNELL